MFKRNTTNLMETMYFLGIDISKKSFHAALTTNGAALFESQVENKRKSINSFFEELKQKFGFSHSQLIVCMEHTGIYSNVVLDYLVWAGIKVCVEPAVQIKKSQGIRRGKSDAVDCRRIAEYAFKNQQNLKFWQPQRKVVQQLKSLLVSRERLINAKVQLQVPIQEAQDFVEGSIRRAMTRSCQLTLRAISKDIARVEDQIEALVRADQQINHQRNLIISVPGIGNITALNIILATGEFKRISEAKKFACYAGVAPFEHTSGSSIRGKTHVSKMANMTIKRLLHMAAMSAIKCCQELRAFYNRKVAEGKNKMSVLNAVRNKLISRVFACIIADRPYQKDYKHTLA